MAITFVNAGAESIDAESGTLTLAAPSSPQNDDVWIAVFGHDDIVTYTFSGWTELAYNATNNLVSMAVYYHRYAGSTPNLAITVSDTKSGIGGIASFRGVKTSGSPANVVGTLSIGAASTTISHSAVSPSVESALLVCNVVRDDNTRTALGGDYAVAFEDAEAGTQNCYRDASLSIDMSVACSYDLSVPASSTGTIDQTQSGSDAYGSVLIALEPADAVQPAGYPYDHYEGGVPFVGTNMNWGGVKLLRTLSGLLVPQRKLITV